jgi:hypothetical protein
VIVLVIAAVKILLGWRKGQKSKIKL